MNNECAEELIAAPCEPSKNDTIENEPSITLECSTLDIAASHKTAKFTDFLASARSALASGLASARCVPAFDFRPRNPTQNPNPNTPGHAGGQPSGKTSYWLVLRGIVSAALRFSCVFWQRRA
jgi:hypothetical protein